MCGFFDVVTFDVWNVPDIGPHILWILPERVTRKLSGFGSFEVSLTWIFGGYPDRIQIEDVLVRFRIPEYYFVSAAEPALVVQTVPEMPDDSVPQGEPMPL